LEGVLGERREIASYSLPMLTDKEHVQTIKCLLSLDELILAFHLGEGAQPEVLNEE
jgi:hypothetical protein